MSGIHILFAVIIAGPGATPRPVSLTAEFGSEGACAKAMESIRNKAQDSRIILLTCEKKS